MKDINLPEGVEILQELTPEFTEILTPQALDFIASLQRAFGSRRNEILRKRKELQLEIDEGKKLDFLPETENIRKSVWTIAPIPNELQDRRVEITGPIERKMIINALNSAAKVFMADFEDSNTPTWNNVIQGQINLRDAVNRTISFTNPNGKHYSLNEKTAMLMVRPRGWHLIEKNVLIDGRQYQAVYSISGYIFSIT